MKKLIYYLFIFLFFLQVNGAGGETLYTSSTVFGLLHGTAADTFSFDALIDGSDHAAALAAQQIKHPSITGLFLIHSISTTNLINVYGYAFSADWTFNSAKSAGADILRVVRWADEGIEILDGYNYLEIIAPDDDPIALIGADGSFVGIAPDSNETVFYVADPGNIVSVAHGYDGIATAGSTWQGDYATWQGVATTW